MKKRLLFILCVIFGVSAVTFAQVKTVTNTDLEKFKQKRLQAEKDYRENYARLGFPSPEELEKQREHDAQKRAELSRRLEIENLEREQMRREEQYRQQHNEIMRYTTTQPVSGANNGNVFYSSPFYGAYPYFGYSGYGYFYGGRFGYKRALRRGGNFYDPVTPGTVYPPSSGVRINTGGIRIGVATGRTGFPSVIRSPR